MAFGPNPPPIQAHLCVKGGEAAIAFYEKAFGAQCAFKAMAEDGERVMHANLAMFGSEVMLHDEFPEFGGDVLAPHSRSGASMTISINLPAPADVDAAIARAASAGADVVMPASDVFWGARYGRLRDPFGHVWAFNAPLAQQQS
ncbi:VOC family protein [Bosea sp. (in: a-proteobacteria)]|jgi:PhnB protein|uniref:VOC family protein n=1 Tax=Bosea sp. (in: a-proteobacteria) TaxID=1871050 RepID=UPI002DDD935A|nr:VOC family protein [Bosea sp. (in: a-proteobacteria)]HEV2511846.1 VOC family protein [Bosea sp. (in: a-proteobacteria)]